MRILVVGAGIAGSASAYWLTQHGHDVTLIDADTTPHAGGYLIQLDRTAHDLLTAMGAQSIVASRSRPAPTISVRNTKRHMFTLPTPGYRLARRGELVQAMMRHAAGTAPVQLGHRLEAIEHRLDRVVAHTTSNDACHSDDYDLVIGADGLRSTVRRLVFGADPTHVYDSGRTNTWITVPATLADSGPAAALIAGKAHLAQVFPYPDGRKTLVLVTSNTAHRHCEPEHLHHEALTFLSRCGPDFADLAAHAVAVDPAHTRLTHFAQVRSTHWHTGRVVLLGDAAHCIDPLSGLGAHGALLGAHMLADELDNNPGDLDTALAAYTRRQRRFTTPAQHLTAGLVDTATALSTRTRLHGFRELRRTLRRQRP